MTTLNGSRVLLQGSALIRRSDTLRLEGPPGLSIRCDEAAHQPGIGVTAVGPNFQIVLEGFKPGASLTSVAKGTLATGVEIVIMTVADRIAEMDDTSVYRVHYLLAEGR